MTTNVPSPTFTDVGFVPPTEQDILVGRKADFNLAFGADLNFGDGVNPTPQGQLVASDTAIIGDANDTFCALANGVDPARASGRMQDAIARIYFLSRNPGQSTIVQCDCIGLPGTVIPANALALNEDGNIYFAVSGGVIGIGGTVSVEFACQEVGPVVCAADTLNKIYRTVPGWDTINNPQDGILGTNVESRTEFELRRQASVALNSVGFLDSVLGAVLAVDGVLDAYVVDNANAFPVAFTPEATASASIAGTTLTVVSALSGTIAVGQSVTGSLNGLAVEAGTVITANVDPTHWTVNHSQTVAQSVMNFGGVTLGPNALYVAAVGGDETDVATAIWSKKSPGCPYFAGNTTVTVYDADAQYAPPGVPYPVVYETPSPLPFVVTVNIADSSTVPSDADVQIRAAIVAAFAGSDGGRRVKIGSVVYANRFYRGINALGDWAEIVSLFLGTKNSPAASFTAAIGSTFTGVGSGTNLTVTGITGYLSVGDTVAGTGIADGVTILSQTSGSTGGNGVYVTSAATTVNGAATATSTVMNVTAVASGALAAAQYVFDATGNVAEGTQVVSQLSGSTGAAGRYRISEEQRVASEATTGVVASLTLVSVRIDQAPTVTDATIQVNFV